MTEQIVKSRLTREGVNKRQVTLATYRDLMIEGWQGSFEANARKQCALDSIEAVGGVTQERYNTLTPEDREWLELEEPEASA